MTKKEKFMTFVYLAAIARDLSKASAESSQIAGYATRIPEEQIPLNPMNAAHVYIAFLDGRSRPFNWMRPLESSERGRTVRFPTRFQTSTTPPERAVKA